MSTGPRPSAATAEPPPPHAWVELERDWSGTRVTVMGLGLFGGGAAVARAFARRGAEVTITDRRDADTLAPALAELEGTPGLRFVLGEHRLDDFAEASLVVANPAVPPTSEPLAVAHAAGVPITSEAALFLASCKAPVLAVTGTQGKSSVCNMLGQLLEACGRRVHLGGNIGRPLVDRVQEIGADELVVLELSSYQLEVLPPQESWPHADRPVRVACVTNVLEDHLERHKTRERYRAAKRRLLELCAEDATLIVPGDDPALGTDSWSPEHLRRLEVHPNASADAHTDAETGDGASGLAIATTDGTSFFRLNREELGRVDDLPLPGDFQRTNLLFALGAARAMNVPAKDLAQAIAALTGLPHRLEDLGRVRGHRVWDNAVSTTPDSTTGVLDSVRPGFTLLAGGQAKDLSLAELAAAAARTARRAITFGADGERLAEAFEAAGLHADYAGALETAVERAFDVLGPGEELLFSPAAASFDAYANFRARAMAFRAVLDRLRGDGEPVRRDRTGASAARPLG